MVDKTYHLAPYLDAFGAYLMPQWPIKGSKYVSIYQNDRWNVVVNSSIQKKLVLVKNNPERLYGWDNLPFNTILGPFWGLFNASVIHIGFKMCSIHQSDCCNMVVKSRYLPSNYKSFVGTLCETISPPGPKGHSCAIHGWRTAGPLQELEESAW